MLNQLSQLKYAFIRTRLEDPLLALRHLARLPKRLKHPELSEIYKEDSRIQEILGRVLGPDSNCVDIGAHYGSMLSAIIKMAPAGKHVAVEAIPHKVRFLRRKFPEVDVHGVALSDKTGSVDFHINTKRSGFSGLGQQKTGEEYETITVPCESLDNLMREHPKVDFVKIDVEGAEYMVLSSGREFLARDRPDILFECGPSGPQAFGLTAGQLHDLFTQELRYDVYFLKDYLTSGSPVSRDDFEGALVYPFKAFNWFAQARPSSA